MVVDATFGHRIDGVRAPDATRRRCSPASSCAARGRDRARRRVRPADREPADATVFSNDSFQEFHGEYPWLFDEGRLIGGKPVAGVGWVFVLALAGPRRRRSRRVDAAERRRRRKASGEGRTRRSPRRRSRRRRGAAPKAAATAKTARRGGDRRHAPAPTAASTARRQRRSDEEPARGRRRGGGGHGAPDRSTSRWPSSPSSATTRSGSEVDGDRRSLLVTRRVRGRRRRAVLRAAAPRWPILPPKSAKELLSVGDTRSFVVESFDSPRRSIDLAMPGLGTIARPTAAAGPRRRPEPATTPAEEAPSMAAPRKTAAKKKATAKRGPGQEEGDGQEGPGQEGRGQERLRPRRRRRRRRRRERRRPPPRSRPEGPPRRRHRPRRPRPRRQGHRRRRRRPRRRPSEEPAQARPRSADARTVRRAGPAPPDALDPARSDPPRLVAIVGARAHRHLERQLPQGPPAAGRGVARLRRARRAVPPGDEARRHAPSRRWPSRRSATRAAHHGEGRWNGVAILSRVGLDDVVAGLRRRRRARPRRPAPVGDVRRRAGRQRLRAQRPLARPRPLPVQARLARAAPRPPRRRRRDPTEPARRLRRLQHRPDRRRRVGSGGVRRLDPRERARARGARHARGLGPRRHVPARCTPSPASTRAGTTGPACSTSTRACGSTCCWPPRRWPTRSTFALVDRNARKGKGPSRPRARARRRRHRPPGGRRGRTDEPMRVDPRTRRLPRVAADRDVVISRRRAAPAADRRRHPRRSSRTWSAPTSTRRRSSTTRPSALEAARRRASASDRAAEHLRGHRRVRHRRRRHRTLLRPQPAHRHGQPAGPAHPSSSARTRRRRPGHLRLGLRGTAGLRARRLRRLPRSTRCSASPRRSPARRA